MSQKQNSRRKFVQQATTGIGLLSLSPLLYAGDTNKISKVKIVCVGAHPDDPESGCGGTLAKMVAAGHDVTVIYLTTGEAGIEGKSYTEAAAIRKQEAMNACSILKAKSIFAGQIDGNTIVNNDAIYHLQKLIDDELPQVVFTHWPLDTHADHQAASLLTIQAWIRSAQKFTLYFFEVCTGEQTMHFQPTDYVDITDTQEQKRKAVYCHTSQSPPDIYNCGHRDMEIFRGREFGVHAAEAFIKMNARKQGELSFL